MNDYCEVEQCYNKVVHGAMYCDKHTGGNDMSAADLGQDKGKNTSSGGGSQDSIDPRTECDFIGTHLMNGPVCDRCGWVKPDSIDSLDKILAPILENYTTNMYGVYTDSKPAKVKADLMAWHNTQLKAAIPEYDLANYKFESWKDVRHLDPTDPRYIEVTNALREGYEQAVYDLLKNLEQQQ